MATASLGVPCLAASLVFAPAVQEASSDSPRPPPAHFTVLLLEDFRKPGCAQLEQAVAINAAGEAVGSVCAGGAARAAYWSAEGKLTALVEPDVPGDSLASDINDAGVVVGHVVSGAHSAPYLWSAERGRVQLDLALGAVPLSINASGTMAFCFPARNQTLGATWSESAGVSMLQGFEGDVLLRGINAQGDVTGIAGGGERPARGFLRLADGTLRELGAAAGFQHSHGNALNGDGVVVGLCRSQAGDRAARWSSGEPVELLKTLRSGEIDSAAVAINDSGWIVGCEAREENSQRRSRGMLWVGEQAFELDELLIQPQVGGPVEIDAALDINERGQIVGRGRAGGEVRALRLDPR